MTAEEYIEAYTRGCSNEMVAEGLNNGEPCYQPWMTVEGCKEAVRLARQQIREELEREKQKLLNLIWNEHDKDVMQMTAHKLNKVIYYIDELIKQNNL